MSDCSVLFGTLSPTATFFTVRLRDSTYDLGGTRVGSPTPGAV